MKMDDWVTDTFFSYFPSLNEETRKQRENLLREQQEYYQEYLKRQEATQNDDVSNRENNKNTKESKNKQNKLAANTSVYVRENSPRYRLLQDLKHKVVPVDGYNPLLEEERIRKRSKSEYQRELAKQIEEKRLRQEQEKAKEKEEEERLARKLDEQIRKIRLEAEMEKRQAALERESNQSICDDYNYRTEMKRRSQSENGEDIRSNVSNDDKVYKFFSSSGKGGSALNKNRTRFLLSDSEGSINEGDSLLDFPNDVFRQSSSMDGPMNSSPLFTDQTTCTKCHDKLKRKQSYRTLANSYCSNCIKTNSCLFCGRSPVICPNCRDSLTGNTTKHFLTQSTQTDFDVQQSPRKQKGKENRTTNVRQEQHQSFTVLEPRKPYSLNYENTKEPSLDIDLQPIETLKLASADKRMQNLINSYGDLYRRRSNLPTQDETDKTDPLPIPLLKPPKSSRVVTIIDPKDNVDTQSDAMRRLEEKWQIPAVQKTTITNSTDKPIRVLTQVGAIGKQLQLEKLELDKA